jgi:tetratricopeptide (TPR) repeat protein
MDRWGATQMVSSSERGDNADSLLQQASVYFNNKQFDKALPLLEKAVVADSSNTMALFYRGVTRLHTHGIDAGRRDLEKVYGSESVFRYEAAFYVAVSYAQEKNAGAAKEWLQKIPEGTAVSEKAGELRKKME